MPYYVGKAVCFIPIWHNSKASCSIFIQFRMRFVLFDQKYIYFAAGDNTDTIWGEVVIALPQEQENLLFNKTDSIVLCGHQPDMIKRALEMNVNCLILCQAELDPELRKMDTQTCILSTHRPSVLRLCTHIYRIQETHLVEVDPDRNPME